MSKRIFITLGDAVYEGLVELADVLGNKPATLAANAVERHIFTEMEKGTISRPTRSKQVQKYRKLKHLLLDHRDELTADARLGERVTQILNGDPVTELDRARLALFFNVLEQDIEALDEDMR